MDTSLSLNMSNASDYVNYNRVEDLNGSATLSLFEFVMNVIVDGMLSVLGVVCNILSITVIQSDRRKLSMSVLLQGLAFADIIFLAYSFIYTTLRSVYPYTGRLLGIYTASPYIVAYLLPIGWMAQTMSIWLVTMVTIDRWVSISIPFAAHKWCRVRVAWYTVLVACISSVIFNLPRFFYYHHLSFGSSASNSTSTFMAHVDVDTEFWEMYRTVYHIGLTWAFLFVIPLPVVVILNVKLMFSVYEAKHRQLSMTGTKCEKDTVAVTLNLIVVISVFVICETPDFIASIITTNSFNMDKSILTYFLTIRESLLVFNASVNFVIYCLFYERFRRVLKSLLCMHNFSSRMFPNSDDYAFSVQENQMQNILLDQTTAL